MPNNYWFHRYGYTDFHELDLSWMLDRMEYVLQEVEEFSARLDATERDIDALETRMSTAEERIARQEQDIHVLSTSLGNLGTRITALEDAGIQDAKVVESVDSVEAMTDYVALHYTEAQYTDGTAQKTARIASIPHATDSKAGVMTPTEKAKLDAFSVSNGIVQFPNTPTAPDPVNALEVANKGYVDNLVITGGASVTNVSAQLVTPFKELGQGDVDYSSAFMYTYGNVCEFSGWLSTTLKANHLKGTQAFYLSFPRTYVGLTNGLVLGVKTDGTLVPFKCQTAGTVGTDDGISLLPLVNLSAGDEVEIYAHLVWLYGKY